MRRIEPYFLLLHGVPSVDDRWVLIGIILVIRKGLRWRDALRFMVRTRRSTTAKGIASCLHHKKGLLLPASFYKMLRRQRRKTENMLAKLKG